VAAHIEGAYSIESGRHTACNIMTTLLFYNISHGEAGGESTRGAAIADASARKKWMT
jgi:hypothetical protein